MPENNAKPLYFSKTVVPDGGAADPAERGSQRVRRAVMGRPVKALPGRARLDQGLVMRAAPEQQDVPLDDLVQEVDARPARYGPKPPNHRLV